MKRTAGTSRRSSNACTTPASTRSPVVGPIDPQESVQSGVKSGPGGRGRYAGDRLSEWRRSRGVHRRRVAEQDRRGDRVDPRPPRSGCGAPAQEAARSQHIPVHEQRVAHRRGGRAAAGSVAGAAPPIPEESIERPGGCWAGQRSYAYPWAAGAGAGTPIREVAREEAALPGRLGGGARQGEQAPGGALKYALDSIYQGPARWKRHVCGVHGPIRQV